MKATWQGVLTAVAGVALIIAASTASQAHQVGLALLLSEAGAFLLALLLWNSGRSR